MPKNMHRTICKSIACLAAQIHQYESDTFSSSAARLSKKKAKLVAQYLVMEIISDRCESLDGVAIANALDELES